MTADTTFSGLRLRWGIVILSKKPSFHFHRREKWVSSFLTAHQHIIGYISALHRRENLRSSVTLWGKSPITCRDFVTLKLKPSTNCNTALPREWKLAICGRETLQYFYLLVPPMAKNGGSRAWFWLPRECSLYLMYYIATRDNKNLVGLLFFGYWPCRNNNAI